MRARTTLSLLCLTQAVYGWGELGHRTVAYLAEKYLNSAGSNFVDSFLSNDRAWDISDAALWADVIKRRPGYTHTAEWHYIDAADSPPDNCSVNYSRDCKKGPGCVVSAITNFTARVNDASLGQDQKKEALLFLIHFIGDIHQPLHTELLDRGGNSIHVCFDNHCAKNENLHSIWDTEILHKMRGQPAKEGDDTVLKAAAKEWAEELFSTNAKRLNMRAECKNIKTAETCALEWATEANSHVCDTVLARGVEWIKNNDLGGEYYDEAVPVVNDMIAKAGLRLGAWINALAAASSASSKGVEFIVQEEERIEI